MAQCALLCEAVRVSYSTRSLTVLAHHQLTSCVARVVGASLEIWNLIIQFVVLVLGELISATNSFQYCSSDEPDAAGTVRHKMVSQHVRHLGKFGLSHWIHGVPQSISAVHFTRILLVHSNHAPCAETNSFPWLSLGPRNYKKLTC